MTNDLHALTRRDVLGGMGAAALALSGTGAWAQGKDPIKFATLMDFTKIYTFVSVEYNQGEQDYIKLVNAEGGIAGHPVELIVKDHIPMLTLAHGRGDAVDGKVFPYVFPAMANYWSQAALLIQHIRDHEGGLKGKKIAHVHIDTPFGREPIPLLKKLAEKEGFDLQMFPYPAPGTEQASTWTSVRRFKPDQVLIWGAGPGQAVSVRTAISNGIPVEKIHSVIWMTATDTAAIGAKESIGLKRFSGVDDGDVPIVKRIIEKVVDKGQGSGDKSKVGGTYYNVGVAGMAIAVEGARLALKKAAAAKLTGQELKGGLESIKAFNAENMMPSFTLTPDDHQCGGWGRVTMWDGKQWKPVSDWTHAYQDVVWELARESAAKFQAENKA
jgi:branched-chain amino acid transport system substrate-binding protein